MKSKGKILLQQGESDCGVACLLSIIHYYGGSNSVENLRSISGTTITGTTLLGLYQAANECGFDAEGCEASLDALMEHNKPCILNVVTEQQLKHYVVFWGTKKRSGVVKFLIGDPAKGNILLEKDELNRIWTSKACLIVSPNSSFVLADDERSKKRMWIWDIVKKDIFILFIASLTGVIIAGLGITMSLFSQALIDSILPEKNYAKLILGITLVLILMLAKEAISTLRQYFLLRQSKDFGIRLSDLFYSHLLNLPKSFFDTRKTGEFTSRLSDTSRIQRVVSQLAGSVIADILVVLVSLAFVFSFSFHIGLICLLVIPIYFIIVHIFRRKIIESQRQIMSAYAVVESNYISTLKGVEPIKNGGKQTYFSDFNKNLFQNFQQNVASLGRLQAKLLFFTNAASAAILVGVLLILSYQVMNGSMKAGELVAILGICGSLLPGVGNLALVSIPLNEAKVAFDRLFEFTSIASEDSGKGGVINDVDHISVKNISFRFPGRAPVLKDVTFEFKKGEIAAIIGENGSGKSTFSSLIQGHYKYECGSIHLNNIIDLQTVQLSAWRNLIASVPQDIHVFNGTVLHNIAYDEDHDIQTIIKFLKEMELTSFIESLPQSYYTIVGEGGVNLSGGAEADNWPRQSLIQEA